MGFRQKRRVVEIFLGISTRQKRDMRRSNTRWAVNYNSILGEEKSMYYDE